jgi:hypothetical protein
MTVLFMLEMGIEDTFNWFISVSSFGECLRRVAPLCGGCY